MILLDTHLSRSKLPLDGVSYIDSDNLGTIAAVTLTRDKS